MASDTALAIAAGLLSGLNRGTERRRQQKREDASDKRADEYLQLQRDYYSLQEQKANLELDRLNEQIAAAKAAGYTNLGAFDFEKQRLEMVAEEARQKAYDLDIQLSEKKLGDYDADKGREIEEHDARMENLRANTGAAKRSNGGGGGGSGAGGDADDPNALGGISAEEARVVAYLQEKMQEYYQQHMIMDPETNQPKGWDKPESQKEYEAMEAQFGAVMKKYLPNLPSVGGFMEQGPTPPPGQKTIDMKDPSTWGDWMPYNLSKPETLTDKVLGWFGNIPTASPEDDRDRVKEWGPSESSVGNLVFKGYHDPSNYFRSEKSRQKDSRDWWSKQFTFPWNRPPVMWGENESYEDAAGRWREDWGSFLDDEQAISDATLRAVLWGAGGKSYAANRAPSTATSPTSPAKQLGYNPAKQLEYNPVIEAGPPSGQPIGLQGWEFPQSGPTTFAPPPPQSQFLLPDPGSAATGPTINMPSRFGYQPVPPPGPAQYPDIERIIELLKGYRFGGARF